MPSASQRLTAPTTATAPMIAVTARPRVLTDLGDRLGDRARGLLLLLGDAAGEVVVEEAESDWPRVWRFSRDSTSG